MSVVETCPQCKVSLQRCPLCTRTTCGLHLTLAGLVRQSVLEGVAAGGGRVHVPGPLEYVVLPQSGEAYRCQGPDLGGRPKLAGFDPLVPFRAGWEASATVCVDCRYGLAIDAVRAAEDGVRARAAQLAAAEAARALAEQQVAAQRAERRVLRIAEAQPRHDAHRAARRMSEQTDEAALENEIRRLDEGIALEKRSSIDEGRWNLEHTSDPTARVGLVLASRIAAVELAATLLMGIGGGRLLALRVLAVAVVTCASTFGWTQLYILSIDRRRAFFVGSPSEWSVEGAARDPLFSPRIYFGAIAVLQALVYWATPGHPATSSELAAWLAVMITIAVVAGACFVLPVVATRRAHERRRAEIEARGRALVVQRDEAVARLAGFRCPWECVVCKPWLLEN